MIINNQYVMTMQAGMNMKDKLVKLAKSQGFTDRNTCIFVGKANLEEKGLYSYVEGTKEALNVENFESFLDYFGFEYVGYCGNENVYLYK